MNPYREADQAGSCFARSCNIECPKSFRTGLIRELVLFLFLFLFLTFFLTQKYCNPVGCLCINRRPFRSVGISWGKVSGLNKGCSFIIEYVCMGRGEGGNLQIDFFSSKI